MKFYPRLLVMKKYAYQGFKPIFGLNKITIKKIVGVLELKPLASATNLTRNFLLKRLKSVLFDMTLEFQLRIIIFSRIMLLIYNKTYRGMRHMQGLPTRGQRTHANGQTPKNLKKLGKNLPFKFKKKIILEKGGK